MHDCGLRDPRYLHVLVRIYMPRYAGVRVPSPVLQFFKSRENGIRFCRRNRAKEMDERNILFRDEVPYLRYVLSKAGRYLS